MILKNLLGLAELTRAEIFYIHESTKVVVVDEDKNLVFVSFLVVFLYFKGFNNS